MLREIDKKKYKLEILKVNTAKAEFEFRIEERLEDINRLKEQIKLQEDRVVEIEKLLSEQ